MQTMFLVYLPVISVSLYFCAKCAHRFLPTPARRAVSRVVSKVVIAAAFASARVCRYTIATRSAYIWDKRGRMGNGVLVGVFDALLQVDADQTRVHTSSGHASIEILEAVATVHQKDCDITNVLDRMWADGDGLRMNVPIKVALGGVRCENDSAEDMDVTVRIRYRGHSNQSKRYPAETFSARYTCKGSQTFRFPPYASSESIRRGLGTPRILRCNFVEENGKMLLGPEATESSGLRRNYYADVEDDPCLLKNVVTFFKPSTRFQEQEQLVVTTSKSNLKIFCNLKEPTKLG
ncbi:EsV-1-78 [Ectocarpus siliculosus virus 1]|uniref:EsV-1-78 n=1 Tax=Ectocarpus siliculosus virus 1 (isolate New Zealand/Kaikoura/1988) TaxID=654926 RepID=Q8QNJ5_ESV1K|nr:EsV-1-78 [Ectocarpus siliculosus virus 1]AAK14501.1 EsV-1-78 [Ectocarpus siliculosus virus 1]